MKVIEGYIPFKGYKTYYKVFGEPVKNKAPLLVLHGGPGSAHNYMLGLSALAKQGMQVIFYDQLGGGLSDHPNDDSLWTIPLFVDELRQVRKHLQLDSIHLLGHSWGGMLAIEYLLTQPKGIKSVILASSMISMPLYQKEVEKLRVDLPKDVYSALVSNEKANTINSKEYAAAVKVYEARHIYRGKQFPKELKTPKDSLGDSYRIMWGASEAYANGSMKKWDKVDRLKEILAPTLITSGQYDELTPEQALITQANIPHSKLKIFTAGSHCVHVEQPDEYVRVIKTFLDEVA